MSLLVAFDTHVDDVETERMLREARVTEARLDRAQAQRKAVGEGILAAVAALLGDGVYGVPIEDAPAPLRTELGAGDRATWSGRVPTVHERDLFFSLPTRPERQSRVLTLEVRVALRDGRIVEGHVSGPDLFVLWAEADSLRAVDAKDDAARARAQAHAVEILSGALEARLPASRCTRESPRSQDLVARACDGWEARVVAGRGPGDPDAVFIRAQ